MPPTRIKPRKIKGDRYVNLIWRPSLNIRFESVAAREKWISERIALLEFLDAFGRMWRYIGLHMHAQL